VTACDAAVRSDENPAGDHAQAEIVPVPEREAFPGAEVVARVVAEHYEGHIDAGVPGTDRVVSGDQRTEELIEQQGYLYEATGRPDDALAWWRRAAQAAPDDYGISMHDSTAFLLERLGRLPQAADEWRFIVNWCEEHDAPVEAQWPREMLQRIEAALGAR
jgi:tetratricopeptide (TPR) repeat protein